MITNESSIYFYFDRFVFANSSGSLKIKNLYNKKEIVLELSTNTHTYKHKN